MIGMAQMFRTPPMGAFEKVADVRVTSDVSSVLVADGLDLDRDVLYQLIMILKNPLTVANAYRLCLNGDTTWTNYYFQHCEATGTIVAASRVNDAEVAYANAGTCTLSIVTIVRTPDGYPRWVVHQSKHSISGVVDQTYAGGRNVAENVKRIELHSANAGGIGAGSRIILLRLSP